VPVTRARAAARGARPRYRGASPAWWRWWGISAAATHTAGVFVPARAPTRLAGSRRPGPGRPLGYDDRAHDLAPAVVGQSDHGHVRDPEQPADRGLHLRRRHGLAARSDHLPLRPVIKTKAVVVAGTVGDGGA
jgi:hypothetical protein